MARRRVQDLRTTPVRRKPSLDFSVTGLVYCSMMMFMGLAAVNSQANLLFGVFGLMIGILLIAGVISRMVLRRLFITRILPDHAVVDRPVVVQYEFRNDKRFWPSISVTVAELDSVDAFHRQPQAYLLHAAPRMSVVVPAELLPKRRGLYHFERFQISTSFPFGFIKRATELRRRDSIMINPALGEVDARVLTMCQAADNAGATTRPRQGGLDEFYGVKEYRPGESQRFVHWRRSARTGTLVSKEMSHVSPPRLMVVVDTQVSEPTIAEQARVEHAIAMAASLVNVALESGLQVGLTVCGEQGVLVVPTNRGKRHRRDLLSALSMLGLNRSVTAQELLERAMEHRRVGTTLVLFTPSHVAPSVEGGRMVVFSPVQPGSQRLFRFPPHTDFSACIPEWMVHKLQTMESVASGGSESALR